MLAHKTFESMGRILRRVVHGAGNKQKGGRGCLVHNPLRTALHRDITRNSRKNDSTDKNIVYFQVIKFSGQKYPVCNKKTSLGTLNFSYNICNICSESFVLCFVPYRYASISFTLPLIPRGVFYEKCYLFCVGYASICLVSQRVYAVWQH